MLFWIEAFDPVWSLTAVKILLITWIKVTQHVQIYKYYIIVQIKSFLFKAWRRSKFTYSNISEEKMFKVFCVYDFSMVANSENNLSNTLND